MLKKYTIDLIDENKDGLQEVTRTVDEDSKKFRMEISARKTRVMVAGKSECGWHCRECDGG